MKITFYGTRGSLPIAHADSVRYGGNTTCLHIDSPCIPRKQCLVVDAGSGIRPLAAKQMKAQVDDAHILFTHYHHDHTQGLLLSPWLFDPSIKLHLYGPIEHGIGPIQMMNEMMRPPFFPISFAQVKSHINGKGLEHPPSYAFAINNEGSLRCLSVSELESAEKSEGRQLQFGKRGKYSLNECLIVRMYMTNHSEQTVCYRFEERRTGKVFVFLTDHENQDTPPASLVHHLAGADLLVMDSQYNRTTYAERTAGFGHGTPDYCVRVAHAAKAKQLGLTHHDPASRDMSIEFILADAQEEAQRVGYPGRIFACADYQTVEL